MKWSKETRENSRAGVITVDLKTGEVSYTYSIDRGMTWTYPAGVVVGIPCGPSIGGGLTLEVSGAVNPVSLSAAQGPYLEAGVGCGVGCANISLTLNISGGIREKVPVQSRYALAEFYGESSVDITANACGVIKFRLASWKIPGAQWQMEIARASF